MYVYVYVLRSAERFRKFTFILTILLFILFYYLLHSIIFYYFLFIYFNKREFLSNKQRLMMLKISIRLIIKYTVRINNKCKKNKLKILIYLNY